MKCFNKNTIQECLKFKMHEQLLPVSTWCHGGHVCVLLKEFWLFVTLNKCVNDAIIITMVGKARYEQSNMAVNIYLE